MGYCKLDCRDAILNEVYKELAENRYTFSRVSNDTIRVNSKQDNSRTKSNSKEQAHAIAEEMATRTRKSFNGHVAVMVNQLSTYDPVTITFTPSQSYIDYVYRNLPAEDRNENPISEDQKERTYINNNTGENTNDAIYSQSPTVNLGRFAKYVQLKKDLLNLYQDRLNKIKKARQKPGITTDELTKLKALENKIDRAIDGSHELGIKGLKQIIPELEKSATIESVRPYIEQDLARLDRLVESNDVDDLNEAEELIRFYNRAGSFNYNDENGTNPFFDKTDIFTPDSNGRPTSVYALPEDVIAQYRAWANTANGKQNKIYERKKRLLVEHVNANYSVKATYGGKKFTEEELLYLNKGLGDTDWFSMWTMDITNGIWSTNGILPQVIFSTLVAGMEKDLAWHRDFTERVNKINPLLIKELERLDNGKHTFNGLGIFGLKGVSYNLFKEITKEGNETHNLIDRFTNEFDVAKQQAKNIFDDALDEAKAVEDYDSRQLSFRTVFKKYKEWLRENTVVIDFTRIPKISSNPEFNSGQGQGDATYEKELIDLLGQRGYDEAIEEQEKLLRKYNSNKQAFKEELLIQEGKGMGDDLSDDNKSVMSTWDNNHNPLFGVENYFSTTGRMIGNNVANNYMDFNHFVPRKFKISVIANTNTRKYEFKDSTTKTGYHNEDFEKIEANDILREFYDLAKEFCQVLRENTPYELQVMSSGFTLPDMMKTSSEMIMDKNTSRLASIIPAMRKLMESIRTSFGINEQSQIGHANVDPVTRKANYGVNDSFLRKNSKAIWDRKVIEQTKFMQSWNATGANYNLNKISYKTLLPFQSFSEDTLLALAGYVHVNISLEDIRAGRTQALKNVVGGNVQIGRLISDYAKHTIVQSQSFDLPKMMKYYSAMIMKYKARQEALPMLNIIKDHYNTIKKPETTNLSKPIKSGKDNIFQSTGNRTRGMTQMGEWFNRVILDRPDNKHSGEWGSPNKINKQGDTEIATVGNRIYTKEERAKIKEIDKLIKNGVDAEKEIELRKIQEGLGKTRTVTAMLDNLLGWIRMLRLGYNVSSAITNFAEGITSNLILGATNQYFDPKELLYAYRITKWSFVKNLSFGSLAHRSAIKVRKLADKFDVVIDSKNELQKSSHKTLSSRLSWLGWSAINQRTEYNNQTPLMVAILRTMKVKDKNGNESSVWDAYDDNGNLLDDFKDDAGENLSNWEHLTGEQYANFKIKLNQVIGLGHGMGYDELRGMLLKSSSSGRALGMFKTWLPSAIYWRFGTEKDDILSGIRGFKPRYQSYTPGSATVHGSMVGGVIFGPMGFGVGAALGWGIGKMLGVNKRAGMLQDIKDTAYTTKQLFLKSLGMPINLLAGRQLINDTGKGFTGWVGKGEFSGQDAQNLQSNMADLALQLFWLAMILMVKSIFWDDDDDPDSVERIAHNIMINKLVQLSNQATSYVNPHDIYNNTVGSIGVVKYLEDLATEVDKMQKMSEGRDIITSGIDAGRSGLWLQTKKVILPGIFKSPFKLGFEAESKQVFKETPYHHLFQSDEKQDEQINKGDRAELRRQLKDSDQFKGIDADERDKQIERIINEEYPTPKQLEKLGISREEYETLKEQGEQ